MTRRIYYIGTALLLFLCIDYYVLQAFLITFQHFPDYLLHILTLSYWTITFVTIVGLFYLIFRSSFSNQSFHLIRVGIITNYFSKIFVVLFLFIGDLIRFLRWLISQISMYYADAFAQDGSALSRPEILAKAGVAAAAVPFTAISYGVLRGAYNFRVQQVELNLPHLPESFDGLRIAQISDIHAGTFLFKRGVARGVDMLLDQKPDLIFFTGDLINHSVREMEPYMEIFERVQAPLGVYAILGNHDYKHPRTDASPKMQEAHLQSVEGTLKKLNWQLLRNEHDVLYRGNDELAIIGVENWGDLKWLPKKADIKKAMKGVEESPVKLLLAHDPSYWDKCISKKYPEIDVTFAGHTHGMQMGLEVGGIKWSPSKYFYKYWGGLYREHQQYLYVNRGFGCIAFPGRIGMPPEITVFTLRKGENDQAI